jgi:sulfur-carrier protein adenylyltransferase/sulfurtransferase
MTARYATQMALTEIGAKGQERLRSARVLVVGAGGLGCAVLPALAGAGIGRLTVIDPDRIELHNLHRQTLYREADIGQPKATTAAQALRQLNGEVNVLPVVAALDPANAPALIEAADAVVDAADSFAVTYTLSDHCRAAGKPLISASVLGFAGYVGGFCAQAPSYRAVFPDLPKTARNCATAGTVGPAVGVLGMMQAQMVLAQILGLTPSPLGQLISVDLLHYRFSGFSFVGAEEPETAVAFIGHGQIHCDDIVIDLRSASEAPVSATATALRMTIDDLASFTPPGTARVVLCCRSGLRAWRGANLLAKAGHRDLALLALGG